MTTPAMTALLIAALTGQADMSPLVQEIQNGSYARIAVCPRPIILQGESKTSVDDIALLATEQIQQITQQLITQSQGTYEVVDPDVALSAMKGMTIDDLSKPEVRRSIGQQTGARAMVFVFAEVNQQSGQWDLFWKLVELEDSTVAVQGSETLNLILSDAAYMGESFEVRRWGPNGIDVVGFDPRMPRESAMGVGPDWERIQYASLQQVKSAFAAAGQTYPHPLENSVPYGIELIVNGRPAVPERICDKLYVAIDPAAGPQGQAPDIGIRMFNRCGRPVFIGLYIDGINMINQQRELPITTPISRHWSVRDGYDQVLRHWFNMQPGGEVVRSPFVLVDAPQAMAAQQGLPSGGESFVAFGDRIDDRLGMITCIVYTRGWDGVDVNPNPAPQLRSVTGRYAFGAGQAEQTQVRWDAGERGILLAAMTLHYRTPDELNQFRAMGCGESLVKSDIVHDTQEGETVTPELESSETTAPIDEAVTPELPGEDAAFPNAG